MNASVHEPDRDGTLPPARAMFEEERLPFPPVPAPLAAALQQQGPGWFATRPVASSPYGFDHFLAEVEAHPDLPDYAVVGFDGHGTNSWAVHFYLVGQGIALFIQLPWGGAYLEPGPARAEIADLFAWAEALLTRVRLAEAARKIPQGMRLQVAASRFGHAGWRWLALARGRPGRGHGALEPVGRHEGRHAAGARRRHRRPAAAADFGGGGLSPRAGPGGWISAGSPPCRRILSIVCY